MLTRRTIQPSTNPARDFREIWEVSARKRDCDVCAASCISKIEELAERIDVATRDPLARVVIVLCNTQRCAVDQMRDVAAAVEARAAQMAEAA
jgi:hypothetical protein